MSTSIDFDRMVVEFMNDDPLTVYLIQPGISVFNPSTGENVTNPVEIPCRAIRFDKTLSSNGASASPNSLIQEGDTLVYLQPPHKNDPYRLPIVIDAAADKLRIFTEVFDITTVKRTDPSAANVILYELYIRK